MCLLCLKMHNELCELVVLYDSHQLLYKSVLLHDDMI
jgi:hypothetical protein